MAIIFFRKKTDDELSSQSGPLRVVMTGSTELGKPTLHLHAVDPSAEAGMTIELSELTEVIKTRFTFDDASVHIAERERSLDPNGIKFDPIEQMAYNQANAAALAAAFRELADLLDRDAPAYDAWIKNKKSERNNMTPPEMGRIYDDDE